MRHHRRRKNRKHKQHLSVPQPNQSGAIMGTLVMSPSALRSSIELIAYGPDEFVCRQIDDLSQVEEFVGKWPVVWVNVDGLGSGEIIYRLGAMFGLHPLAMEDVAHAHQRAKVESYGEELFVVAHAIEEVNDVDQPDHLNSQQVSMFLGKQFLLTFHERPRQHHMMTIRERLRRNLGKLRVSGPDYLAYVLLDSVIDGYYPVLENYADYLDDLEEEITLDPGPDAISRLHDTKSNLLLVRRTLRPHREALAAMVREPLPAIQDETRVYLRDCYDHTMQLFELAETYREVVADLRDLQLSSASHRMNEIMQVLTIISTVFLPLTFIVGIYGMNFDPNVSPYNMPELRWRFGYPLCYLLMMLVTIGMVAYYRRRGWLRGLRASQNDNNSGGTSE